MDSSDRTEKTAGIQRGRPFQPGKSGNPQGRPRGARNRATVLAEALLDDEASAITRKLIDKAKEGDTTALRLCLERLLPPRRERAIEFELPQGIETLSGSIEASAALLEACASGSILPDQAAQMMGLIESHIRLLEMGALEERLAAFEKAQKK